MKGRNIKVLVFSMLFLGIIYLTVAPKSIAKFMIGTKNEPVTLEYYPAEVSAPNEFDTSGVLSFVGIDTNDSSRIILSFKLERNNFSYNYLEDGVEDKYTLELKSYCSFVNENDKELLFVTNNEEKTINISCETTKVLASTITESGKIKYFDENTVLVYEKIGDGGKFHYKNYSFIGDKESIDDTIQEQPITCALLEHVMETKPDNINAFYVELLNWLSSYGKDVNCAKYNGIKYSKYFNDILDELGISENLYSLTNPIMVEKIRGIGLEVEGNTYTYKIEENFDGYVKTHLDYNKCESGSVCVYFSTDDVDVINEAFEYYLQEYIYPDASDTDLREKVIKYIYGGRQDDEYLDNDALYKFMQNTGRNLNGLQYDTTDGRLMINLEKLRDVADSKNQPVYLSRDSANIITDFQNHLAYLSSEGVISSTVVSAINSDDILQFVYNNTLESINKYSVYYDNNNYVILSVFSDGSGYNVVDFTLIYLDDIVKSMEFDGPSGNVDTDLEAIIASRKNLKIVSNDNSLNITVNIDNSKSAYTIDKEVALYSALIDSFKNQYKNITINVNNGSLSSMVVSNNKISVNSNASDTDLATLTAALNSNFSGYTISINGIAPAKLMAFFEEVREEQVAVNMVSKPLEGADNTNDKEETTKPDVNEDVTPDIPGDKPTEDEKPNEEDKEGEDISKEIADVTEQIDTEDNNKINIDVVMTEDEEITYDDEILLYNELINKYKENYSELVISIKNSRLLDDISNLVLEVSITDDEVNINFVIEDLTDEEIENIEEVLQELFKDEENLKLTLNNQDNETDDLTQNDEPEEDDTTSNEDNPKAEEGTSGDDEATTEDNLDAGEDDGITEGSLQEDAAEGIADDVQTDTTNDVSLGDDLGIDANEGNTDTPVI